MDLIYLVSLEIFLLAKLFLLLAYIHTVGKKGLKPFESEFISDSHMESTNLTKSLVWTFFVLFHTARNLGIDFIALIANAHLSQNCSSMVNLTFVYIYRIVFI
jgi:hypothetical protein